MIMISTTHCSFGGGYVAAVKPLVGDGADISMKDRWGNTARMEAERANAGQVFDYRFFVR